MNSLYILYDPRCGLCTSVRDWLLSERSYPKLILLASDSNEARRMFPMIPAGDLAAISDDGRVWMGDNAFIISLWALRRYRAWSRRLAAPLLRPLAKQAFAAVSRNRHGVSSILGLRSEVELKKRLNGVTIPPCQVK